MFLQRVSSLIISGALFFSMFGNIGQVQAASPLGYPIGKATKQEITKTLGRKVEMTNVGANIYTRGATLQAKDCEPLNMKGLETLTVIFDPKDRLSAIVMNFQFDDLDDRKSYYDRVLNALEGKYELTGKSPRSAPDKLHANFKSSAGSFVQLTSKRLGKGMQVRYLSKDFVKSYANMKNNAAAQTELTQYNEGEQKMSALEEAL